MLLHVRVQLLLQHAPHLLLDFMNLSWTQFLALALLAMYDAKSFWEEGLKVTWMLKKMLRGWGMHATDSRTAKEITPSPAKILFFTP